MGLCIDPGRPSEHLQAEHLAKFGVTPEAEKAKQVAAQLAAVQAELPAPPAGVSSGNAKAPAKPEKKISVEEFNNTGKLPLEALPTEEVTKLADAKGIKTKDASREKLIEALKGKGVDGVEVDKK